MSFTTDVAERTLQTFRKRRSTPACYPCSKRKIKCRGGRPCEACIERGHPDICHVEEAAKGSRRHPKGKLVQNSPSILQNATPTSIGSEPSVGELSAISFVQNSLGTPDGKHDAFHVMGMRSSGLSISLLGLGQNGHGDLNSHAPLRAEVLQFYPVFRDLVMPLYPVVPNALSLETWIANLLHGTRPQIEHGKLAVILSALSLGVQFTDAQMNNRWEMSQNFITRASIYLQAANCIFEPSTEAVQSLLMIGIALQNLGLSHGAWNLLGLTYRCAQSLGLHHSNRNDESAYNKTLLWTAVTWQDALMSLRYDRTPLTHDELIDDEHAHTNRLFPPYYRVLDLLCRAGRNLLRQPKPQRRDPKDIFAKIAYLETIIATAPEHLNLRYLARTLQQKCQFYSFRVHSSLLMVEFCRPSFSITESENNNAHREIRRKGINYSFTIVESFLELCTFSNVPLRLWSLTQAAVSCALVLSFLVSKQSCTKAEHLLPKLVNVLRTSDSSTPLTKAQSNIPIPEIYGMHAKSADLIESILDRQRPIVTSNSIGQVLPTNAQSILEDVQVADDPFSKLSYDEFFTWPTDLSLFDDSFSNTLFQANIDESPS